MSEKVNSLRQEIESKLAVSETPEALEEIRVAYLGKKGKIKDLLKSLSSLSLEEKKTIGKAANILKRDIEATIKEKKESLSGGAGSTLDFDYTMPGIDRGLGKTHPLTQTIEEISDIFIRLGFEIVDGREIETEHYNFTALNIPLDHASRDSVDTFYTEEGHLLRSQTSSVQARIMENRKPPLSIIAPGKVYRPDTVDANHSFMFHQMEGLLVDEKVSFSDLKGVLHLFLKEYFGKDSKMRFRPHFFPFTEPSVEVDVTCFKCKGSGCRTCSQQGWLEVLGAGSVDPAVFKAVGYDPDEVQGFAFGLGIERMCMLKNGIHDIRYFYENNYKFLKQF